MNSFTSPLILVNSNRTLAFTRIRKYTQTHIVQNVFKEIHITIGVYCHSNTSKPSVISTNTPTLAYPLSFLGYITLSLTHTIYFTTYVCFQLLIQKYVLLLLCVHLQTYKQCLSAYYTHTTNVHALYTQPHGKS